MENRIGDTSTIIKIIVMTIAPYMTEAAADQTVAVIAAILGFVLAIIDAYYPNNFKIFNNNNNDDDENGDCEYERGA